MDVGIVTSFYNGYDRFLPQWALSICRLKLKPKKVVMVQSGRLESFANREFAEAQFKKAGIDHLYITMREHNGMGYARNMAVRNCITEWVMYLDVDDTVLPNALKIVVNYEKLADVICTGLKVTGDRKNRTMIFENTTRESILAGLHGSCSHSVFKKKFWESAPWIETNDYCEQPFWLGLAQAGATFVGTKEVCTVYHARKDGHNLSLTPEQRAEARKQFNYFKEYGVHRRD